MVMDVNFRWNEWNRDHATKHGCTIPEIESVCRRGNSRKYRGDKYITQGRGQGDRMIQVIFIYDNREPGDDKDWVFVIHAMPLTLRRRRSR